MFHLPLAFWNCTDRADFKSIIEKTIRYVRILLDATITVGGWPSPEGL